MKEFHGTATARIDATPKTVFDFITDVNRLPEWNGAIEHVVERPPSLEEGATWTVKMHPPRMPSWGSISKVENMDRDRLRFAYETRNTDGNPSYAKWSWDVVERGNGSEVSVRWDCYLATPDRRFLAGPLRKRGLAREVPQSLANLTTAIHHDVSS
jgi:uncharacterized protein YndB with AHSA1/START domain